jgi:3-deoxy-D-arabino-heptulosonate 7-phosphate (DAHP) synthase class II
MNELASIYTAIKGLIKNYEGVLIPKNDTKEFYDLWSNKEIVIENRKRKEIFFASVQMRSNYVGFYYMPVYTDEEVIDFFNEDLLSKKRGLSCFHIKKLDDKLLESIKIALEKGYELYKKKGWID